MCSHAIFSTAYTRQQTILTFHRILQIRAFYQHGTVQLESISRTCHSSVWFVALDANYVRFAPRTLKSWYSASHLDRKVDTNVLSMAKNFRVSLTTMKIIQSPLSSTMVRLRLGMSSSELMEHTPLFARPFLGRKMQSRPLYPTQLSICMSDMATQRRPCSCDRSIP